MDRQLVVKGTIGTRSENYKEFTSAKNAAAHIFKRCGTDKCKDEVWKMGLLVQPMVTELWVKGEYRMYIGVVTDEHGKKSLKRLFTLKSAAVMEKGTRKGLMLHPTEMTVTRCEETFGENDVMLKAMEKRGIDVLNELEQFNQQVSTSTVVRVDFGISEYSGPQDDATVHDVDKHGFPDKFPQDKHVVFTDKKQKYRVFVNEVSHCGCVHSDRDLYKLHAYIHIHMLITTIILHSYYVLCVALLRTGYDHAGYQFVHGKSQLSDRRLFCASTDRTNSHDLVTQTPTSSLSMLHCCMHIYTYIYIYSRTRVYNPYVKI